MKQRTKKIGIYLVAAAAIGYIYAIFVKYTGLALPCVFHSITGLECPGCGITRMCVYLLHLDFKNAFYSNQMLFILLPVLAYLFGSYMLSYIRNGCFSMSKKQTVLTYICIGFLLLFAVYRNINGLLN